MCPRLTGFEKYYGQAVDPGQNSYRGLAQQPVSYKMPLFTIRSSLSRGTIHGRLLRSKGMYPLLTRLPVYPWSKNTRETRTCVARNFSIQHHPIFALRVELLPMMMT